jgi:hypothetical protein
MTTQVNNTSAETLTEFAQLLKDNGFTVLLPKKYTTWFHFFKDGKFGYVQFDKYASFSTVHKPCKQCGTGFGVTDEWSGLTIDNAIKALMFAPHWANTSDVAAVRKYNSIDEFINSSNHKWAEYYTL